MAQTRPATRSESHEESERLAAVRRYEILDTPPDGAFDRVCAIAARVFDVPIASVSIVDEDRIWFKAIHGLAAREIPREPGLCASAVTRAGPYVIADGATDPRVAGNSLVQGEAGIRFYAAVPITTSDGHRLGTVNVLGTQPREITDDEAETLRDLAAIVMNELELRLAAIRELRRERAQRGRIEAEKHGAESLARTLQETLSPSSLPPVPGLDIAQHYQPFAAEDVGGDFYDVFPLADGRWGFFLGDVCGKGPEAATLTSLSRYTLRTAALLKSDPATALAELNTALLLDRPGDLPMVTVAYGHIEVTGETADVSVLVAGHPAPLVIRSTGEVESATARGPVLGVLDEPTFEPQRLRLEPGDALLLYSDGILDILHGGLPVTPGRLAAIAGTAAGATAAGIIRTLRDLLDRVDQPLRDDVALLAIRVG